MTEVESGPFDCVVVGGGIHGTYLANALQEQSGVDSTNLAVLDPNDRLLASFREKTDACGMSALRSAYVQHLGLEAFGLETFAQRHNREDELISTVDYPDRPSLKLFLDHADHVIAENDLDSLHRQATVDGITEHETGFRLETTDGSFETRTCVLAIGHGGRYRYPDWAAGVDGIDHVWAGFDPDADVEETIVVGGGTTAGQLACTLTETQSVTLLNRHALEWETAEAAPPWVTWRHIEAELHGHPPGSEARFEAATGARHEATMPPYLYRELEKRLDEGSLSLESGDVDVAQNTGERVKLRLDRGRRLTADRIVLATGFEPAFDHPFVEQVAGALGLDRGYRGMPVLDDDTLAWRTEAGEVTGLFVSGALALGSVGPYAPNLPGARRAAERIVPAIEETLAVDGLVQTAETDD